LSREAGPDEATRVASFTFENPLPADPGRLGGAHAGPGYAYAWQTRWPVAEFLQPGFEIYGGSGEAEAAVQHRGGPVLSGVVRLGAGHDVRYELGYLRGFNRATPDSTVKLLIGYEIQF
jgi:hypothetical protein